MEISLAILLLPYALLVFIFLSLASAHVYHVARFGTFDTRNRLVLAVFFVYVALTLAAATGYLLTVDWSQVLSLPFVDSRLSNPLTP